MKSFLVTLLLMFSTFSISQTTIYLVRHAEKKIAKNIKDPELTQIGQFRALNIAKQLSEIGITEIYSTNYKRTMQTAQPLADHLQLKIKNYDPSKLEEFAEQIKLKQGNIFIVGHSNTTPELTSFISDKKVNPIEEKYEYDNLYQVIILDNQTILNRFKSIPSYNLDHKTTKQVNKAMNNENK